MANGEVYLLVRPEEVDGIYVFARAEDRDAFAACFSPLDRYEVDETIIERSNAQALIEAAKEGE